MTTTENKTKAGERTQATELEKIQIADKLEANFGEAITIRDKDGMVAIVTHLTLRGRRDIRQVEAYAHLFASAPELAARVDELAELLLAYVQIEEQAAPYSSSPLREKARAAIGRAGKGAHQ